VLSRCVKISLFSSEFPAFPVDGSRSRMAARRFLLRGRVQGVGFRYFVLGTARRMGLSGWTRNLPDGAVEVLAQGEAAELDTLEAELSEGPPAARVATVESFDSPELPGLEGFHVRF